MPRSNGCLLIFGCIGQSQTELAEPFDYLICRFLPKVLDIHQIIIAELEQLAQ